MKKGFKFNPLTGQFDLVNKFSLNVDGGALRDNPISLLSGANVTIVDNGDDTFTFNANAVIPPVLTGYFQREAFDVVAPQSVFLLTNIPFDATQILVFIDGALIRATTDWTFNSGTNEVTLTTPAAVAQTVSFYIGTGLGNVLFLQEQCPEASNGVNRSFSISGTPLDPAAVILYIDGVAVPKNQYMTNTSGQSFVFNLGCEPAFGQSVSAVYQYDGPIFSSAQEIPYGVSDGVNDTFGPLRFTPNEDQSAIVMVNGLESPFGTGWSLVGKNIQFNGGFEPAAGQSVSVYYYFAEVSGAEVAEYITLTQEQVNSDSLQLSFTPREAAAVLMDIRLQGALVYGDDFIVSGNTVSWISKGFDGVAVAGMKVRLYYFI